MNFQRKPGTVFVTVPEPTPTVPSPESYERSWEQIAQRLAFETPQNSRPEEKSSDDRHNRGTLLSASDTDRSRKGNPSNLEVRENTLRSDSLSTSPIPEPEPEQDTPTIDDIFAESLLLFIEASRWGRYIFPGPASRIHDNTTFIYHNPCANFWDLYEMSKGIFRDLGIRVSKERGTWVAHIPIKCLTDKVLSRRGCRLLRKPYWYIPASILKRF